MVDGISHFRHLLDRHFQPHQQAPVQILIHTFAEHLHPRKIPGWLNVIRKINDFLQQRHIRMAGGVPPNSAVNFIVHAVNVPCNGRAGLCVEELQGLLLQLVQLNAIFTAQRQLLLHLQLLRAVMQQRSHSCLFNIRAIALCQPDRLLLRSFKSAFVP